MKQADFLGLQLDFTGWKGVLLYLGILIAALVVAWILIRCSHLVFQRIQRERKNLKLSFFEHLTSVIIIIGVMILTLSALDSKNSVWKTLLGGTAIVSAVLAFAAQDAIKDILAGLMLSLHHLFEIGNRIELEDGTAGIVEEMTMRHVVIAEIDSLRRVIPNSRINAMTLTNYSYLSGQRAANFRFAVGYDTDIDRAKEVVFEAVEGCPLSVPEKKPDGSEAYRPVYFIALADSALMLSVTVYYEPGTPTEAVKDDINTRVRAALLENGIEIPYNYVTVVSKES